MAGSNPSSSRRSLNTAFFLASGGQAGELALHVGQQGGHTDPADLLHQALQGHRLAGASSAGDQAVTVGEGGQQATVHRARGVSAGGRPGDQQGLDGDGGGSLLGRSVGVVNGYTEAFRGLSIG